MYLNKAILYGNLTRDPEIRALTSGQSVVNFSVATNRVYKDKDGNKKDQVEFHNVVAFGKTGDLIAQYMRKGSPIYVEGRIQTRSWEGDDKKKNYRTEVVVDAFQFGPNPNRADGETRSATTEKDDFDQRTDASDGENPEDIPF